MREYEPQPLTPAQHATAAELGWYRAWLIATCTHPTIADFGGGRVRCVRCRWQPPH